MASGPPKEPFKRISAAEAKRMMVRGNVQLVDVRQPNEYTTAHIREAILIPVDQLLARIGEVAEDKEIIFHCAVGVRSALACEIAAAMGRTRCYNMEGGIDAWKAQGFPHEAGPHKA